MDFATATFASSNNLINTDKLSNELKSSEKTVSSKVQNRSTFLSELAAAYSALNSGNTEEKSISSEENLITGSGENNSAQEETEWEYSGEIVALPFAETEAVVFTTMEDLIAATSFDPYELAEKYTASLMENKDLPTAEKYMEYYKETLEAVRNILSYKVSDNNTSNGDTQLQTSKIDAKFSADLLLTENEDSVNKQNNKLETIQNKLNAEQESANKINKNSRFDLSQSNRQEYAPNKLSAEAVGSADKNSQLQDVDEVVLEKQVDKSAMDTQQPKNEFSDNKNKFSDAFQNAAKNVSSESTKESAGQSQNFTVESNNSGIQTEQSANSRSVERVLQWEAAKDAVNLAKVVQQAGQNGATKLTVRLAPEHLGKIEIQLTELNGRIDAKLSASNQESKAILVSHADAIKQQLMERGIHIDNMDFAFNDTLHKQGGQNSENPDKKVAVKTENINKENLDQDEVLQDELSGLYA